MVSEQKISYHGYRFLKRTHNVFQDVECFPSELPGPLSPFLQPDPHIFPQNMFLIHSPIIYFIEGHVLGPSVNQSEY